MSTVTMSRQTSLSGAALQNAVGAMVAQMQGMNPYSMLNPQASWESGSRLALRAGGHMSGTITIQPGNPSTVTARIDLLSGLAQAQRSRVERDMEALADQHLSGAPAAAPGVQAAAGQPHAQPAETGGRRVFDWGGFGSGVTGFLSGFASGLDAFSNRAGEEAVAIAQEEAVKQGAAPGKQVPVVPASPKGGALYEAPAEVADVAPAPDRGAPPSAPVETGAGLPVWAWVAIGAGGAAMLGLLFWAASGGGDDEERDDELKENYGFRYFL